MQKNPGANLECLPRELLDDIFEHVRLDRIDAKLPQLTDFISPALLPSIRPNLYYEIVVKSVASFTLLVNTIVSGPSELALCIERLAIENTAEDANIDIDVKIGIDSPIAVFFTRAAKIAELRFRNYPDLVRFLLTPYATANFLPEIEVLDIGILRHPSLVHLAGSARRYKTLVRFMAAYLPAASRAAESSQVGEMAWEVEGTDLDGTGSNAEMGGNGNAREEDGGEGAREQLGQIEEQVVARSKPLQVFLDAPLIRPEVVELVRGLGASDAYFLVDSATIVATQGNPDFLPVLDAIDPLSVSYLSLRLNLHRFYNPLQGPLHPINSALSRFTNLQTLEIGAPIFSDATLPTSLSSLASLKEIQFTETASPSYSTLRSLISGPTKLKSLVKLDLQHIQASRGRVRQPRFSLFDRDIYEPDDGWSPGLWTNSFSVGNAKELIVLAEAEGVDLGTMLKEDIVIEAEWMEEMDHADEHAEAAERQREEEEEEHDRQYLRDNGLDSDNFSDE